MTRLALIAGLVIALVVVAVAVVFAFSGASLSNDPVALARLDIQVFGGTVERVHAVAADGVTIPVTVARGRLTPKALVSPGERVSVVIVVSRPGWSAWALGSTRRETLTIVAPTVHIRQRWVTVRARRATVHFDAPVARASVGGKPVAVSERSASFPVSTKAGTALLAVAPRAWERPGTPFSVTWFPAATGAVAFAQPRRGAQIDPLTPLRLTFSAPVSSIFGTKRPTLSEHVPGRWIEPDGHTLVFEPTGYGAPFASDLHIRLPNRVDVVSANTASPGSRTIAWSVAPASFLRLQQLLAEQGYLPLSWTSPAGDPPHTARAELEAAVEPPSGRFSWRFANTPHELMALWQTGKPNRIVQGGVMMFQDEHHLTVDGIVGAEVWRALLVDAVAGKRRTSGYSYVYVHRNVPQLMTLWHNGSVVLTSPGNTGVPAAPTALGTFPVFEHIPVGRMSGTNPDGSHYNDPGIRWISYFHGGEALHAFTRASFGTPQSLGCVELPLASAAKVWPYTPIGTLVTIEN